MRHGPPAPALHKSEKRWQLNVKTDEETDKLRTVKGILNKLTPENFERLSKQIMEVLFEDKVVDFLSLSLTLSFAPFARAID